MGPESPDLSIHCISAADPALRQEEFFPCDANLPRYSPSCSPEQIGRSIIQWKEIGASAFEFALRQETRFEPIRFDNADPAFPPFEPGLATLVNGVRARPEAFRCYTSANEAFNPLIVAQYFEKLGIRPPSPPKNGQAGVFYQHHFAVGLGATHLYKLALQSILEPGDVFLVTAPTYGLFTLQAVLRFASVETIPLRAEDGWRINPGALDDRVSRLEHAGARVRGFLHMNPHNPLGVVEDEDHVRALAEVCCRRDLIVIDDLAYAGIEYPGCRAAPMAAVTGMEDRTLTLFSLSKAFGMPAMRSGLAVGPHEIVGKMVGSMLKDFESPPVTSQLALLGTLNAVPDISQRRLDYLRNNAIEYELRRDLVQGMFDGYARMIPAAAARAAAYIREHPQELDQERAYQLLQNGIPGASTLNRPDAGYFQLIDFSALRGKNIQGVTVNSSMDLAKVIAAHTGVLVLPGELMQFEGPELVARLSYALPPRSIVEGIGRIADLVKNVS